MHEVDEAQIDASREYREMKNHISHDLQSLKESLGKAEVNEPPSPYLPLTSSLFIPRMSHRYCI